VCHDTSRQFYQRFMIEFFANILAQKIAKPNLITEKLLSLLLYEKTGA
jgi:hypothetical protein